MSRVKLLIIFTVLVDVIGIGIVIPSLPYYVTSLGARPLVVTLLFTAYSLCSFFSAPFLGALSDRIGRRPVLIASIISTAIGWFVFAATRTIWVLFLGRMIDGLAAGNISTAQSSFVDISKTPAERTTNLGLLGAVFGVGFIIGPLLGGLLGHAGPVAPFWFAGALAALNAILAIIFLPETNTNRAHPEVLSFNPFRPIVRALGDVTLRPAYLVYFLFGLGAMSVNSVFALYLQAQFGFGALVAGLSFAGIGAIIVLNQGFGLKHFWLKKFREPDLELAMLLVFAIGYGLMSLPLVRVFFFGLALTAFCQSVLRVVLTSQAVGAAAPHMKGEVLGILTSVMSLTMIIAPAVAGLVFEYKANGPFLIGALYLLLALSVAYYKRQKLSALPLAEDLGTNALL